MNPLIDKSYYEEFICTSCNTRIRLYPMGIRSSVKGSIPCPECNRGNAIFVKQGYEK